MERLKKIILYLLLLNHVILNFVHAHDSQQLFGDYPFVNTIELEGLQSRDVRQNNIVGSHQFERKNNHKFGVFTRYAEFSHAKKSIPDFYTIQFGGSYRQYLGEQRALVLMGSLGSSSDKPFRDGRDNTFSLNSSYQFNDKWMILGNYSNNRPFLNNVPLPGFIYMRDFTRTKVVMLGFPFFYVLYPFAEQALSFKYIGLLPYNHKLKLLYNKWSVLKPYVGFEQGPTMFFDSDRGSDDVRTFWFERRVILGAEKSFGPVLKLDLQFGQSYDRAFFYARSFRRREESSPLHDGVFSALTLKSSF